MGTHPNTGPSSFGVDLSQQGKYQPSTANDAYHPGYQPTTTTTVSMSSAGLPVSIYYHHPPTDYPSLRI